MLTLTLTPAPPPPPPAHYSLPSSSQPWLKKTRRWRRRTRRKMRSPPIPIAHRGCWRRREEGATGRVKARKTLIFKTWSCFETSRRWYETVKLTHRGVPRGLTRNHNVVRQPHTQTFGLLRHFFKPLTGSHFLSLGQHRYLKDFRTHVATVFLTEAWRLS